MLHLLSLQYEVVHAVAQHGRFFPVTMTSAPRHRVVLCFVAYVAAVLILSAILAPVFHVGGRMFLAAAGDGWRETPWVDRVVEAVEKAHFPRYCDRAALVVALAGLWPLFQNVRLTRAEILGDESWACCAKDVLRGFGVAAIVIALMGVGFCLMGACDLKPMRTWNLIPALGSVLCVACMEKFFLP